MCVHVSSEYPLSNLLSDTPGIAFYVHATFLGYLTVDAVSTIIVHLTYRLKILMWDVILHHLFFIIRCLCQQIPLPHYAWITACAAYTMEVSTIFLNGNFMAKWYKCSESVIFRFKLGFLISSFLMRVQVTISAPSLPDTETATSVVSVPATNTEEVHVPVPATTAATVSVSGEEAAAAPLLAVCRILCTKHCQT